MFKRTKQWLEFSEQMKEHIDFYTVPQYGDAPDDNVEPWTSEDCIKQISKYANRAESNARAGQELSDLMKIAHYAQLAHMKKEKELQHGD